MKVKVDNDIFPNIIRNQEYDIIRTEEIGDDLFYIVVGEDGKEEGIIDMVAIVINDIIKFNKKIKMEMN